MIYDAVAASARTCCAICEKTCKLNIETNGELLRGVAAGSGNFTNERQPYYYYYLFVPLLCRLTPRLLSWSDRRQ